MSLPKFHELPQVSAAPQGCAWGLFDENGIKDQVGTLNLLTPTVVIEASKKIRTGESVVLNWGLENPPSPYYREKFEHEIIDVGKHYNMPIQCFDDTLKFNTQSSSQWDGFSELGILLQVTRSHSQSQGTGAMQNLDSITMGSCTTIWSEMPMAACTVGLILCPQTPQLMCQDWSERGGIVARGVLVNFVAWAERNQVDIKPASRQVISLDVIKEILREENIDLTTGDILILRTGLIQAYNKCKNDEERDALMRTSQTIGAEASENMVQWLWNNHFSTVAGDAAAFEAQPFAEDYALRDYLLVWWGMPIGEMWDLEALAAKCQALKRWTFFVTSAPLNVKGGVASPPNALAVF
ncbi:hypothetical protein LTR13_011405 [Exophiala sideris]|nr:hypothetical protein LTR13_011405 [Exophiala sideris]